MIPEVADAVLPTVPAASRLNWSVPKRAQDTRLAAAVTIHSQLDGCETPTLVSRY